MKRCPSLLGCATALLAASFLLAEVHPFGKPDLSARASAQQAVDVPPDVAAILGEKCADCHSGPARMPFYGHLAPASWLIEHDVTRARGAMDLSRWSTYSPEQQETLRSKIAQQAKKHSMPPPQYVAIHWRSRLDEREIRTLTGWAAAHPGVSAVSENVMSGDAASGRLVFEKRCTGCHALTQDREGPRLQGGYGRAAGTVPNFDYSNALRSAHVQWNETTLDRWLADPDAFLPGNNMEFHVARPQERADVIRFLREQSGR